MKTTKAQLLMLENVAAGRNPGEGYGSGTHAGQAASHVMGAILRKGWLRPTHAESGAAYKLTPDGRAALERGRRS